MINKINYVNILAIISICVIIGGTIRAYSIQEAQIKFDHQKIIENQQDIAEIKKLLNDNIRQITKYGGYYG